MSRDEEFTSCAAHLTRRVLHLEKKKMAVAMPFFTSEGTGKSRRSRCFVRIRPNRYFNHDGKAMLQKDVEGPLHEVRFMAPSSKWHHYFTSKHQPTEGHIRIILYSPNDILKFQEASFPTD
ncbi:hypothetical protein AVEN_64151-1 [Araneus ventricosus]|uniref:Uncharacterized protein n=1 Tax=Araneus ventricosus TaxID=182803 RepID=A0A4Y2C760_ARAVE|nr:hypothetical protein AVEN_64151-1 [Araneus ventricosus]